MQTILKHGELFIIFDPQGNLPAQGGLFFHDTRYLSCWELSLQGLALKQLAVTSFSNQLICELTNLQTPDIPGNSLHLRREINLHPDGLSEVLNIRSYANSEIQCRLTLNVDADFCDLFELRGLKRKAHGQHLSSKKQTDKLILGYRGLDHLLRQTEIQFSPQPNQLNANSAEFILTLPPQSEIQLVWQVKLLPKPEVLTTQAILPKLSSPNQTLNNWLEHSRKDLDQLLTLTPEGLYPYAGLPWYSTVFGRDGIITALQTLNFAPQIAKGVLQVLAATQATALDPSRDAEPGKILHERRQGEMAQLGEIPYGQYYGSVDATPLFILLAGEYWRQTGDLELINNILPQLKLALDWIDTYGDRDGDGFVEYFKLALGGLVHQGWKDSGNAVIHADGRPAAGPIALCEVQAYVYAARLAIADLAEHLGVTTLAQQQRHLAKQLQQLFEAQFWCEELGAYGLALDGDKQLCRVLSSNTGHVLFTGIASPERAKRIAQELLSPKMFSGWGICTLSTDSQSFNPMSYHNGSIWPHDNALIAAGFARYGLKAEAERVFNAMLELSQQSGYRLPELICGFKRREDEAPVPYPVACSPQAWAAGAVYQLVQAADIPVSKIN